ncbi:hypothetical protein JJE00_05350 [Candidatus Bathyarchaeota archaeon]|nr:hypothetical protein [Candidatus Bathyarchaeota archaeon]
MHSGCVFSNVWMRLFFELIFLIFLLENKIAIKYYINTINVSSIDNYIDMIKINEGEIIIPKTLVSGVGWTAAFQELQGNTFGLMQDDPTAK